MKTATRPDDLEMLRHLLQEGLQSKLAQMALVQVRCLLRKETLMILVEHPADVVLEPQKIFDFFKQTIFAEHQSVSRQIEVYLRVAGQKQPYGSDAFSVESFSDATTTTTVESFSDATTTTTVESFSDATATTSVESLSDATTTTTVEDLWNSEGLPSSPTPSLESTQNPDAPETVSASPHPWDEPITGDDTQPSPQPTETVVPLPKQSKHSLLPLVVTGASLSLVVFFSTLYVLTRPCVIGRCTAMIEAQELTQRSQKMLQKPQSGKQVLEAQQQLKDGIRILESIPMWSGEYAKAQSLLKAEQIQAKWVDQMVVALKTAARASAKSDHPPYPASKWIEIQGLWREAIAQLEQLPTDSNLQPLAKQKIKEYQGNLAAINQRLLKERQAQEYLNAAKEAALIASARQGVAQSLAHWQLVYSTWQTAMQRLKQIPQGTTTSEEAQQLSALYLPKMAIARNRKTQEQIAANAYNQGLRLAQLAKESQGNNQWSAAITHWRNALTYVKQVPNGTFYYSKAQSLISPYSGSLKLAQGQLQFLVRLQQARSDLHQSCSGKAKICNYTIINNVIKVRLTPVYTQLVKQIAIAAKARGDAQAQAGVVNHILSLGQALEAISDNARIPLEVYGADGSLIQTHNPGG